MGMILAFLRFEEFANFYERPQEELPLATRAQSLRDICLPKRSIPL